MSVLIFSSTLNFPHLGKQTSFQRGSCIRCVYCQQQLPGHWLYVPLWVCSSVTPSIPCAFPYIFPCFFLYVPSGFPVHSANLFSGTHAGKPPVFPMSYRWAPFYIPHTFAEGPPMRFPFFTQVVPLCLSPYIPLCFPSAFPLGSLALPVSVVIRKSLRSPIGSRWIPSFPCAWRFPQLQHVCPVYSIVYSLMRSLSISFAFLLSCIHLCVPCAFPCVLTTQFLLYKFTSNIKT